MSKCVYCRQRKGRRPCPGLTGLICSQCCGEHRLTRIACPPDCVYLDAGNEYQQRRLGEQFGPIRRDLYRWVTETGGDKAAALCNFIEAVAFSYFHDRRDGQDAEILAAIQALRRTLSPLHVPSAPMPVFAEHLKKEYDAFAKQQPQQLVDTNSAPDVLDRFMAVISEFSGGEFQSRRYLQGLIGYVKAFHPDIAAYLTQRTQSGRLVLPSELTPAPPEPHVHSPECRHHH